MATTAHPAWRGFRGSEWQQGIDVGVMDNEDIVDPAKEWALRRFSQMSATFDYNIAVAKLALATGWDAVTNGE